jgi:Histidine kinase-like ATPase domain
VSEEDLLTASRPEIASPADRVSRAPLLGEPTTAPAAPTAVCTLSPSPGSAKAAREFTRATLRDWGLITLADVAELVVSELVTNAVQHGIPGAAGKLGERRLVRLRLLAQAPFLMCVVADPGLGIPVLREADPDAETGRGLTLVDACCVRWGWHLLDEGGKVVWALLR